MFVYAGIDEAGYGPILGPLVIARSVFVLEDHYSSESCPPLWSLLKSIVCKAAADKKRRIAINDSKLLYNPAGGLRNLERGVLSFVSANGCKPDRLDQLLDHLAFDAGSIRTVQPWYAEANGMPKLPVSADSSDLLATTKRLVRASSKLHIGLADISAAVVFEDRFNCLVSEKGSKAACSWEFVSGHLRSIWDRFCHHGPWVVIDRQGGRKRYADLLQTVFPEAGLTVLEESNLSSRYRVVSNQGTMNIIVQVKSEISHLPTAFSSMTAKYVRELLMMRFQEFWKFHAPEVKPTFGYFVDGKRFLRQIEPLINKLCIDPETLVRSC